MGYSNVNHEFPYKKYMLANKPILKEQNKLLFVNTVGHCKIVKAITNGYGQYY